jgi:polar amino acid transport system substrate-binding protein
MKTKTWISAAIAAVMALTPAIPTLRAQGDDHPSNQALRVAADMGYAPWAIKKPTGGADGFQYDVGAEIAKRLGRPGLEMIDVNFSAIFSGLFAKRYEFIIAPTSITKERAEQMLFTEGYIDGGIGFVIRKSEPAMKGPEDLKGKVLATNRGSLTDTWATENESKYGYTIQRYDKDTDALQAVLTGRAYADIVDLYVGQYAATKQPQLKTGHILYSDRQLGYPFRKDDVEFRNRVERIIECMKIDGTFVKIHRKWFGSDPGPGTSMTKVFPGYGPPGFPGHLPDDHKPQCS